MVTGPNDLTIRFEENSQSLTVLIWLWMRYLPMGAACNGPRFSSLTVLTVKMV